jgi:hypothetical protein
MRKRIWIKLDLLNWQTTTEGGEILNQLNLQRAHEIWRHAALKLTHNATEMDRVDAITTLKRCLNQRLKQFEKEYKLIPFLGQNSNRYLQLLEQLGLIRPLLIQYLMDIRNEIEHEDKKPPKIERCLEMLDVVWYFLKSTDAFMKIRASFLLVIPLQNSFQGEDVAYWIIIDISISRNWKMTGRGWLPQEYILAKSAPNCLEVLTEILQTNQYWKERGEHLDKNDTDLYFSGSIVGLPDKLEFARLYFAAY